jgi:hypothetical protein
MILLSKAGHDTEQRRPNDEQRSTRALFVFLDPPTLRQAVARNTQGPRNAL